MDKLISQQAAIDALKELTANGTNKGMVFGEDAVHRIEMLPSVQPERKPGQWITHLYKFGKDRYECDSCHKRCDTEYCYCPNCGADMREQKLQYADEGTAQSGLMSAT